MLFLAFPAVPWAALECIVDNSKFDSQFVLGRHYLHCCIGALGVYYEISATIATLDCLQLEVK